MTMPRYCAGCGNPVPGSVGDIVRYGTERYEEAERRGFGILRHVRTRETAIVAGACSRQYCPEYRDMSYCAGCGAPADRGCYCGL